MCELYHDDCRYDKPPPMSQLIAMAKRLQEAEQAVSDMRAGANPGSGEDTSLHADAPNHIELPSRRNAPALSIQDYQPPSSRLSPSLASFAPPVSATVEESWENGTSISSHVGHSTPKQPSAAELTVDENGNIRYYGPTSAVHEPAKAVLPALLGPSSHYTASPTAERTNSLAAYARESEIWEEFAIGNASLLTGIPRHVIAKLLHIHWTWVAPMFLWVYRPAFIRTSLHVISYLEVSF